MMDLTYPVTLRNVTPVTVSRSGVQRVVYSALTVMKSGAPVLAAKTSSNASQEEGSLTIAPITLW
jgi:hypothetical protein